MVDMGGDRDEEGTSLASAFLPASPLSKGEVKADEESIGGRLELRSVLPFETLERRTIFIPFVRSSPSMDPN